MHLESIDKALLGGEFGESARRAMDLLLRYGELLGAERFIDIESAHIDSCLYHGRSGLDFVRALLHGDCKVRVRTTLNVTAFDLDHPGYSEVTEETIRIQKDMVDAYLQLGCLPTMTCAPYQRLPRPGRGQHVAWAESNAIVFVNSVLGARTDRYGDFTDICAALTGRVPLAGLHRSSERLADLVLDVPGPEEAGLERDLWFAGVGYLLGEAAGSRVAAITGAPHDASEDEMKALGAAAASSGGVAMFHLVGVTPEAPTLEAAIGGNAASVERKRIGHSEIREVEERLCTAEAGDPVSAVCLGTPHFSMDEFRRLSEMSAGCTVAPGVEVLVTTSREIASGLRESGWFHGLEKLGVKIVTDTCTYLLPAAIAGRGAVVTNSAKYAHYGPGNTGRKIALMSLERCLRCAEAGEVVA